ncbi:MAG: DNA-methyltransferase [Phycisphaerales bacterium]
MRVRCLEWLEACAALEAGSADLVYVDPPFNTGLVRRGRAGQYADRFGTLGAYIEWLRVRVAACVRLLAPTGSIIVHVDWRTAHRVRVMLDETLGEACFVNHLVWSYGLGGSSPRRFARKHDDLLWYSREPDGHYFRAPLVPATSARLRGKMKKATDVLDIASLNNMARERTGYPTQKPVELLRLLIEAGCPVGGLVVDPCCGSGTTGVAAALAGRRAEVSDMSPEAAALTTARLRAISEGHSDGQGKG